MKCLISFGSWEHILHQLGAMDRIVFMSNEMKKEIGKKDSDIVQSELFITRNLNTSETMSRAICLIAMMHLSILMKAHLYTRCISNPMDISCPKLFRLDFE